MQDSQQVSLLCQRVIAWLGVSLIVLSPWFFGSAEPIFEFAVVLVLAIMLLVAAVWFLIGSEPRYQGGRLASLAVTAAIGLALVAGSHVPRVPESVVQVVAPGVSQWTEPAGLVVAEPSDDPTETLFDVAAVANDPASDWFAGTHLGFRVGDSLRFALRVSLLAALFTITISMSSPRQWLSRLARVAVVLGTAMALFGLAQHFGSHDGLAYWTYPVQGGIGYGPFVNRNHYPFFINLTIGLTVGMVLQRIDSLGSLWYRMILSDRFLTWLLVALTFMVASLITCVSRGGVISLMLASAIVFARQFRVSRLPRSLTIGALVAVPTMCLLVYLGFDIYESRLNMLSQADRYTGDGRWNLWRAALQSIPQFPWFGSGGETFRHWDTMAMFGDPDWTSQSSRSIRADNEWLDVANEFGLLGAACLITLFGSVGVMAWRAAAGGGLAAGAAIGLLAVMLHSMVDFGLRIPATGIFATIVAGLVCCQKPRPLGHRGGGEVAVPRWKVIPKYLAAAAMILVAFSAASVFRRDAAADRWVGQSQQRLAFGDMEGWVDALQQSVAVTPEQLDARLRLVRALTEALDRTADPSLRRQRLAMIRYHSGVAIRLCPIAWRPYAWLVQYAPKTIDASTRLRWLAHAQRLHPGDPDLAFLTGRWLAEMGRWDAAMNRWRESLTYSTKHLPNILERSRKNVDRETLVTTMLPPDPVVVLAAAKVLRSKDDASGSTPPDSMLPDLASPDPPSPDTSPPTTVTMLADRVLQLLADPVSVQRDLSVQRQQEVRSEALQLLGRSDEAMVAMRLAVNEDPLAVPPRLRLTELLVASQRWEEATIQIRILLQMSPEDRRVLRLRDVVNEAKSRRDTASP